MKLPLRDGSTFDISPFIDGFRAKYPHIDIEAECAKAHLWLHKNPSRWPSMPLRFMETWCKRAAPPKMVKLHIAAGGKLTEHEVLALAHKLKTYARPGETYPQFARRLAEIQDKQSRSA